MEIAKDNIRIIINEYAVLDCYGGQVSLPIPYLSSYGELEITIKWEELLEIKITFETLEERDSFAAYFNKEIFHYNVINIDEILEEIKDAKEHYFKVEKTF